MQSEPMFTPKEKSPPLEAQRIELTMQHQAGLQAQHTIDRAILAPVCYYNSAFHEPC